MCSHCALAFRPATILSTHSVPLSGWMRLLQAVAEKTVRARELEMEEMRANHKQELLAKHAHSRDLLVCRHSPLPGHFYPFPARLDYFVVCTMSAMSTMNAISASRHAACACACACVCAGLGAQASSFKNARERMLGLQGVDRAPPGAALIFLSPLLVLFIPLSSLSISSALTYFANYARGNTSPFH